MYVVTYATHKEGLFEKLVNNEFKCPVEVLGWGSKWDGFMDKFKGVRAYLDTRKDDDVVVFLDGWDSFINKDPTNVEELFRKFNCKVLLSKDFNNSFSFFDKCKNNLAANSGMYMGEVKYLKQVLDDTLKSSCKDDQYNLNKSCKYFSFIKIDEDKLIFDNGYPSDKSSDSIFVSYPGTSGGIKRWIRAFKDYTQFFINTIIILFLILMVLFPNKIPMIFGFAFLFAIVFLKHCDKSCD